MKVFGRIADVIRRIRGLGVVKSAQIMLESLNTKPDTPSIHDGRIVDFPIFPMDHDSAITPEYIVANNRKPFVLSDHSHKELGLPSDLPLITSVSEMSESEIARSAFFVYFKFDSAALPEVRRVIEHGGWLIPPKRYAKTPWRFVHEPTFLAIQRTLGKIDRISHFDYSIHENICEALLMTRDLEGDFVEIGVYLGGSALTGLNFLDVLGEEGSAPNPLRKTYLIDTFDGFSYTAAHTSADQVWSGTHTLFGFEETQRYLSETLKDVRTPYELVASNICEDQLPTGIKKIAVANIDVDLYEATRDALLKVSPLIQTGGVIICEDPTSTPWLYGAHYAMQEFLQSPAGSKFICVHKTGSYFLVRVND